MEVLTIYLKLKERMALKRGRKFEATYNIYLTKSMEDKSSEGLLRIFLNKRRDILFEMSTRFCEEERKKAEEEIRQVSLGFEVPKFTLTSKTRGVGEGR